MVSTVCCPLCRTPLARDDISSVPTNFTINRLVEIFKNQKRKQIKFNAYKVYVIVLLTTFKT